MFQTIWTTGWREVGLQPCVSLRFLAGKRGELPGRGAVRTRSCVGKVLHCD